MCRYIFFQINILSDFAPDKEIRNIPKAFQSGLVLYDWIQK
jgi:hypothetical protein